MIVEYEYSGILWDNYQGGSGKPFIRKNNVNIDNSINLAAAQVILEDMLTMKEKEDTFLGELKLLSYTIRN